MSKPVRNCKKPHVEWVRYDAREALSQVAGLSRAAELAHRRLVDHLLASGRPLANNEHRLCDMARLKLDEWGEVWVQLRDVGWRVRRGRVVNKRVQRMLDDSRRRLLALSEAGLEGANARWHADAIARPCQSHGNPKAINDKMNSNMDSTIAFKRAERLTFSPSAQEKAVEGEQEFLEAVEGALKPAGEKVAADEMLNWGGWWRNRYREDPAKAQRVLAELASMVRERRILRNPGAAGSDLWKRFP